MAPPQLLHATIAQPQLLHATIAQPGSKTVQSKNQPAAAWASGARPACADALKSQRRRRKRVPISFANTDRLVATFPATKDEKPPRRQQRAAMAYRNTAANHVHAPKTGLWLISWQWIRQAKPVLTMKLSGRAAEQNRMHQQKKRKMDGGRQRRCESHGWALNYDGLCDLAKWNFLRPKEQAP